MNHFSRDEATGHQEGRSELRLCEHCDLLGVSAVISADRESNEVICCSICNLKFHFLTEGDRIVVTKREALRQV